MTPTSYYTKLRPFKVSASKYIYTHVRAHTHKDVKSWFQLTIPGAKKEKETEKRSSLPESHVVRRCSLYPSYKLNQVRRSARTSCSPKKKKRTPPARRLDDGGKRRRSKEEETRKVTKTRLKKERVRKDTRT